MTIVLNILCILIAIIMCPLMFAVTIVWFPIDVIHKILCGIVRGIGSYMTDGDGERYETK